MILLLLLVPCENGAMLVYLIYLLILTPLIMTICFAYWKNMTEFVVMP